MIALIPALRRSVSSGKLAGFFLFERGDMSTVGVFIDYALCHGTDGLQKVYIDRRPRGLGGRVLLPPGRGPLRERS